MMAARPFRLTSPVVREHPIQKRITDVLRLELAPPGNVSPAGVRIGRGIIDGILDMFVLHVGRAHMIEIKAEDGRLNDAQRSVAAAVLAAGGRVGVVRDENETLACLDRWQIPRARRVRALALSPRPTSWKSIPACASSASRSPTARSISIFPRSK